MSPSQIGEGGGAVTIEGAGFSEDVFNQFDPVLGNKVGGGYFYAVFLLILLTIIRFIVQVWFANEFVSVPCQNPINWNFLLENPQDPSTTRIVCDLPPRDGSKGSDWFSLILKVDGEEVENSFTVRYRDRYTPLIKEVRTEAVNKPCGISQCSEKAPTRAFSLLKALTINRIHNFAKERKSEIFNSILFYF